MEIDVTEFVKYGEPYKYSASAAEMGSEAGRITWRNAKEEAERTPLLTTPEAIKALRGWARESGGWTREEIAAWSDTECNALFLQIISGDLRELESVCMGDDGKIDWSKAEELADYGTVNGCLYPSGDRFFYYLGS